MKIKLLFSCFLCIASVAFSQEDNTHKNLGNIAQDMKNPVSLHYLLPLQNNFEAGDVDDQFRYTLKVEPVVPFVLNKDWKIITRTIIPVIANQYNGIEGNGKSGLSDVSLTGWLAPQKKVKGFVWGVGGAFDIPTATGIELGSGKWTAGPSVLGLKQTKHWTFGLLLSQSWSYAGDPDRDDVSYAFIDPWMGYTWDKGFGVNLESETLLDWANNEQTIPLRFGVSQVFPIGKAYGCINLDGLYYFDSPQYGPKWGVSLTFTVVFNHTTYLSGH